MVDRQMKKQRLSTRERFVSVLREGGRDDEFVPWYQKRQNYLPLFIIGIAFAMFFFIRLTHEAQRDDPFATMDSAVEELEPMDYDEAREIFGGVSPENQ